MISLDINTDVLAITCIKNYIFIGIGCTLFIINNKECKVKTKINVLHPDNIYGILNKSYKKLIIYGKKSLCILDLIISENFIRIEKIGEIFRFQDWIINVQWLGALTDPTLTILFAQNYIYSFKLFNKKYIDTYCKERCLIHSGTIYGQNSNNVTVFVGTVFQEILIWRLPHNPNVKFSEILFRLKGHKGIIFSVLYNPQNQLICSTSDDRTVRLWKISNSLINNLSNIDWKNIDISLQTTMYGHLARVWKVIFYKEIIASIGEDSRICFWNLSGKLLHKIEAHQGAPIWSIDIAENDIVYTGGGDGSVNSWSLEHFGLLQNRVLLEDNHVFPKHVYFTDNDILIYSNFDKKCKLLQYNNIFNLLNSYNLPECFSSYCIIQLSANRQSIVLASIEGNIMLYKRTKNIWCKAEEYKIQNFKIFSVQWLNIDTVLFCNAEGLLFIIKFFEFNIKILSKHVLPYSRERWVTSACMHKHLLICGDRIGSIYIYDIKSNEKDPVQTFGRIHGQFGVQSCTIISCNLITTGRDRTLKLYKFCNTNNQNRTIEYLYAKSMPMDWVSKIIKYKRNYYVLGFKEKEFIIYSLSLKRIVVKIPCGGGHKSWDCVIHNNLINFIYIKEKQIFVVTKSLNTLVIPPLLNAFHTKHINCIKILQSPIKHYILVSGGEDCKLFISLMLPKSSPKIKFIDSFSGHLSSIKCISILTISIKKNINKYLIFSGGGRAQLKIWEISVKTNTNTLLNKNIFCKDLSSYMLHGLDNKRNKIWIGNELRYNTQTETRYMDISSINNPQNIFEVLIFIACSDGYLRFFSYNIQENEIKLNYTIAYKNRCILKVHSIINHGNILLLSMATDGFLKIWNVLPLNNKLKIKNVRINGEQDISLHQSGINSLDMKIINDNEHILATGGDDNLLNVLIFRTILENKKILSVQIISSWKTNSVHLAQITGIKLLVDNRLISVGRDQKLVIHKFSYNNSKINVIFLKEIHLCIPDIQGITTYINEKSDTQLLCVYGKGIQLLHI